MQQTVRFNHKRPPAPLFHRAPPLRRRRTLPPSAPPELTHPSRVRARHDPWTQRAADPAATADDARRVLAHARALATSAHPSRHRDVTADPCLLSKAIYLWWAARGPLSGHPGQPAAAAAAAGALEPEGGQGGGAGNPPAAAPVRMDGGAGGGRGAGGPEPAEPPCRSPGRRDDARAEVKAPCASSNMTREGSKSVTCHSL